MSKKTIGLIIGLLITTAVLLLIALSAKQPSKTPSNTTTNQQPTPTPIAQTTLTLSPNPVSVGANGTGTIDVMIYTGENEVSGVQLELSYDPKLITSLTVVPGTFLQNAVNPDVNKNNEPGRYTFFYGTLSAGSRGSGKIATIRFSKARTVPSGVTQAEIQLLPQTIVTMPGQNYSVLKEATGATVLLTPQTQTTVPAQ